MAAKSKGKENVKIEKVKKRKDFLLIEYTDELKKQNLSDYYEGKKIIKKIDRYGKIYLFVDNRIDG